MKPHREDITGFKNNRLTATSFSHVDKWGNAVWNCICDCGNSTKAGKWQITKGYIKSCGCLRDERRAASKTTHGMTRNRLRPREYRAWYQMKWRCSAKNFEKRQDYFDRGIHVCESWIKSFETFFKDMGECPKGMSLDRIDNDKGYDKNNCRWANQITQCNNKRGNVIWEFNGLGLTISEWAKKLGVKYSLLIGRRNLGWTVEKTLSTPDLRNRRWFKCPAGSVAKR